jgi:outer membrane protein OmpA-like peptidoglycan-associated protein
METTPAESLVHAHAELCKLVALSATELARSGRHNEAEAIIEAIPSEQRPAPLCDLLGRIYAQQGKFVEAETAWNRALELDPTNEHYQRASAAAKRGRTHSGFGIALASVLPIFLISLITLLIWGHHPWNLEKQKEEAKLSTPNKPSRLTQVAPQPPIIANIAETAVSSKGQTTIVAFKRGLFSRGVRLTPLGKQQLMQLSQDLASQQRIFQIDVEGHTDDRPLLVRAEYRDNAELGLARARMVANYLHEIGGIPVQWFRLTTAGNEQQSDGRDLPSDRTVVITVGPNVR